jgi:hypothetical protein
MDTDRSRLAVAVDTPHQQALAALDRDGSSLPAVPWCAAHLAAAYRVLHPVAQWALADGDERVRELRRTDHELQDALWRLDRRLTGGASVQNESVAQVEDDARACLAAHVDAEQAIVAELERALEPQQLHALADELSKAMASAPTRPHPDTPHTRVGDRLIYRFDAVVDRLRDLMDNRSVPDLHRVPPARPAGRWGSYAMGRPFPPPQQAGEPAAGASADAPPERDPSERDPSGSARSTGDPADPVSPSAPR